MLHDQWTVTGREAGRLVAWLLGGKPPNVKVGTSRDSRPFDLQWKWVLLGNLYDTLFCPFRPSPTNIEMKIVGRISRLIDQIWETGLTTCKINLPKTNSTFVSKFTLCDILCSIAHSNSFFKHTNIPLGHHVFLQYLFHQKIPSENLTKNTRLSP